MLQKPKGTKDIINNDADWKQFIDNTLVSISKFYNFQLIETPIFEYEEVFLKSVGESSDIVNKEMYVFNDKKNRKFALRPEGTAGVVRAIVEGNLYSDNSYLKLFYKGPMFRYERPQKGRQRQFNQFGIEIIGNPTPYIDLECILFAQTILNYLKINQIKLHINYLGEKETQNNYKKVLKEYFTKIKDELSSDSQSRLDKNVLRILDSKDVNDQKLIAKAPNIQNFYSDQDESFFKQLRLLLKQLDISFVIDKTLVRGLDYYSGTIFEFISTSNALGSNSAVIGGGRYGDLIKNFGGPNISGIGFGIGIERLILEAKNTNKHEEIIQTPHLLIGSLASKSQNKSHLLVSGLTYMLRNAGFRVESTMEPVKIRKIFKLAEKIKPSFLIIIGPKDGHNGKITLKDQITGDEHSVKLDELVTFLEKELHSEKN